MGQASSRLAGTDRLLDLLDEVPARGRRRRSRAWASATASASFTTHSSMRWRGMRTSSCRTSAGPYLRHIRRFRRSDRRAGCASASSSTKATGPTPRPDEDDFSRQATAGPSPSSVRLRSFRTSTTPRHGSTRQSPICAVDWTRDECSTFRSGGLPLQWSARLLRGSEVRAPPLPCAVPE